MRLITGLVLALLLVGIQDKASSQAPPSPHMQIPDKFTNLQVLPKDISKEKLVNTMRMFSRSLGTRCDTCHVMSEDKADFASDQKDNKNAARNMMKMVRDINANYMPKLEPLPGEEKEDNKGVNCWTCHRGHKEPEEGPPADEKGQNGPPRPQQQEHEDEHEK
jgi:hypothetical protein